MIHARGTARGPAIKREQTFRDAIVALEERPLRGVQAAVDHFVEALRVRGDSLPLRMFDGGSFVHNIDNPAEGREGRERFSIQGVRKANSNGSVTFTLIAMWDRVGELS